MNILQFEPAIRPGEPSKHERHYLDFIISGRSLRKILGMDTLDLITPFGWLDEKYEVEQIQVLTLRKQSDVPTGRVLLYVCPECGDLDCGAITATVLELGDRIVWKDFGHETGYGGTDEEYSTIESIEFERQPYFQAFSRLGLRSAIEKILRH